MTGEMLVIACFVLLEIYNNIKNSDNNIEKCYNKKREKN